MQQRKRERLYGSLFRAFLQEWTIAITGHTLSHISLSTKQGDIGSDHFFSENAFFCHRGSCLVPPPHPGSTRTGEATKRPRLRGSNRIGVEGPLALNYLPKGPGFYGLSTQQTDFINLQQTRVRRFTCRAQRKMYSCVQLNEWLCSGLTWFKNICSFYLF